MILVTGATGFLGKNVVKRLTTEKIPFVATSLSLGLDLRNRTLTDDYFQKQSPQSVIHCAAFVGGIQFGLKNPVDVFENNMSMTLNVFSAAQKAGVKRVIHPISNCVYPATARFFKEDEVWDGELHDSVMAYGMSRKALYVASQTYGRQYGLDVLNLVLSNMYGPEDHFEEERSHALGALIQKFITAREKNLPEVVVWGSGSPVREWLFVEDAAQALVKGLQIPEQKKLINIGCGEGVSVRELALLISELTRYKGQLRFDLTKADGAPFKTVDGSRAREIFNWSPSTPLREGIQQTITWYEEQHL
jgi:GDP-L-fucose synthase